MNLGNFDLRLLRVFDALMAEGNVTRAAARLQHGNWDPVAAAR